MSALALQLKGWRMVNALIYYRMPDHPSVLQSFFHQLYDYPPEYPSLRKFLRFWEERLDGPIHSVQISTSEIVRASEFRRVGGEWRLH
jgi:uncharacterized protein Usg